MDLQTSLFQTNLLQDPCPKMCGMSVGGATVKEFSLHCYFMEDVADVECSLGLFILESSTEMSGSTLSFLGSRDHSEQWSPTFLWATDRLNVRPYF